MREIRDLGPALGNPEAKDRAQGGLPERLGPAAGTGWPQLVLVTHGRSALGRSHEPPLRGEPGLRLRVTLASSRCHITACYERLCLRTTYFVCLLSIRHRGLS